MVLLSREILAHIVEEHGAHNVLRRLSDPFWFQALGCILGFDLHSSGVTTTVCGAVKASLEQTAANGDCLWPAARARLRERARPRFPAFANGSAANPTCWRTRAAPPPRCVVQQGMNPQTSMARRYHWLSEHVTSFVEEPHEAVCCDVRHRRRRAKNVASAGGRIGTDLPDSGKHARPGTVRVRHGGKYGVPFPVDRTT
jgi:hypothetical protein